MGTQVECRSQKFQKTVRYLSEICQKTVSCKNQSEISHKCVRYLSEISHMQNCVGRLLERFGNQSEMYQFLKLCQKTISLSFRNQSEISQKNDFCSLQVKEMCHLIVF